MDKYRLYQHFGSMQQLAYIRSVEFQEGRSGSLKAWQVKNGPLQ